VATDQIGDNMGSPTVLLQQQIERAEPLKQLPNHSPQYKIWCDTTTKIIREHFNDDYAAMFKKILPSSPRYASTVERKRAFTRSIVEKVQLLHAIINEYNRFQAEPSIDISRSAPLQTYDFHQEIKAVALKLYEDKHYPQAVEEAFKRVIQEVKRIYKDRTGQVLDGTPLMNRAFGCTNQTPVIAFNQLQSPEDRDEQEGMMNLFKGIVGIRNKKAHTNVILNNPVRTTEYLSLASLLMRLLDQFAA
jgi:uncharacterized protein (TIGR02391 family)